MHAWGGWILDDDEGTTCKPAGGGQLVRVCERLNVLQHPASADAAAEEWKQALEEAGETTWTMFRDGWFLSRYQRKISMRLGRC